jgi:hypothetical protein
MGAVFVFIGPGHELAALALFHDHQQFVVIFVVDDLDQVNDVRMFGDGSDDSYLRVIDLLQLRIYSHSWPILPLMVSLLLPQRHFLETLHDHVLLAVSPLRVK